MKKILNGVFDVFFLFVSILVFLTAFSQMTVQSPVSGLLVIVAAIVFSFLCIKKTDIVEKIGCEKIWWILRIVSLAVMFKFAFSLEVGFSWDWSRLIKSAYVYGTEGRMDRADYYARYPNNQFWLICLVSLFKFLKLFVKDISITFFKHVTMAVSVVVLQIAIEFIYRSAKLIFSEKKALLAGIMALFCLPFYLYSGFFYTDTPSILLISIMIFLYLKILNSESKKTQIILCVLLGFVGAITYFIKVIAVIVFVAILIGIIFTKIIPKQFICFFLISVATLGLTVKAINVAIEPICRNDFGITEEMREKYEFPPTHWIMMGLGYGGYSQEDVDYTDSFGTLEEKKEANINEIKNRLENYGLSGFLKHTFIDKVTRTFANSTLAGDDYVSRKAIYPNGIIQKIFSAKGNFHAVEYAYSWTYHIIILLGILLSAIESLKQTPSKQNRQLLACRIAFFGIFAFMLIWECNSRYIYVFTPVLILLATDGLSSFANTVKRISSKRAKKQ